VTVEPASLKLRSPQLLQGDCREVYVLASVSKRASPPEDETHYYGPPDLLTPMPHRVLVSATFTWDRSRAETLAEQWQRRFPHADVQVGGPAYGDPGAEFVPGRWLRKGYVITTRGCPGCAHPCLVPAREGGIRCLPVTDGWNVLDNNILAAPREHIEMVLDMLGRQRQPACFSGGLEARRLLRMPWFVARLQSMRVQQVFLAYDAPEDWLPVSEAIRALRERRFTLRQVRCYVLVGMEHDTVANARVRLESILSAGGLPFAMLWRGPNAQRRKEPEWNALVREFTRPALMLRTRVTSDR
jgi:hypothetical protein